MNFIKVSFTAMALCACLYSASAQAVKSGDSWTLTNVNLSAQDTKALQTALQGYQGTLSLTNSKDDNLAARRPTKCNWVCSCIKSCLGVKGNIDPKVQVKVDAILVKYTAKK